MARNKLKPPTSRRGRGRRSVSGLGWWIALGLVMAVGVAAIVASRGEGTRTVIATELTVPRIDGVELVSVMGVFAEPYDRLAEGDSVVLLDTGGDEVELTAPSDGFLVQLFADEGTQLQPGEVVATFQIGPDFNPTNRFGNHWHSAYGVNVCGQWLGVIGDSPGNLHTHADGIIHAHPRSTAEAGTRATLGQFFQRAGLELTSSRLRYVDGNTYRSGDVDCDGESGIFRWALNGEERTGEDPTDLVIGNGDVIALAFVPEDVEMPTMPPSIGFLAENYAIPKHPDFVIPELDGDHAVEDDEGLDGGVDEDGATDADDRDADDTSGADDGEEG